MTTTFNYIFAIGVGFPGVNCHCEGEGEVYENIVWDSGDPLPSRATLDAWILQYVKDQMWIKIMDLRNKIRSSGVKVGTIWIDSDDTSRIQQLALVILGSNLPANIMWKTLNGTFVEMTPTFATQLFMASVVHDQTIYGVAEYHKAAMLASADPGNYDYTTGWPETYTG